MKGYTCRKSLTGTSVRFLKEGAAIGVIYFLAVVTAPLVRYDARRYWKAREKELNNK